MLTKLLNVSLLLLASSACFIARADISQALQHEARTDANKLRDTARKPEQTLTFFEVTPQSTVVEIWPGSGWYTEVLAPLLAEQGKLYAAHFSDKFSLLPADYMQKGRADYSAKLAAHPVYKNVTVTEFAPLAGIDIAPPASADVVLSIRNQFYIFDGETSLKHALANFYRALKPGGVLGVVAPRLPDHLLDTNWKESGYVPEQLWLDLAKQAGFSFEARSDMLLNPQDSADHPAGIWSLPPTLAGGEKDKARYIAIGEVNQMVLKFRKPAN
ncbi:class I SAM-dependent methyltransferase [Rheinheimera sp. YQF-2]|uniref:Class I SAM-dependent methyltransferase n=1 Tax=Rheinheimera lutimaris TaxID=2740584 RepID=A0A7Y5ARN1_9GAMM|nr:class I SAM-dependent methyltransferase [Rheinheimera lutimaris]NRQ43285.1 class I SAM-dependent methyltransferase [Rheinheimera lutimaris]